MRSSDFEQIYGQYYGMVYRYALTICRDPHRAEDLAQETFAKALLSLDESRNIAAWLHTVCRHLWIDQCRRDKRLCIMSGEQMENELGGDTLGGEQDHGLLRQTRRLPPAMGEAVLLFYDAGLNCAEIAQVQHTTPGAVRTLLYRARIQLKKLWEDDRDEIQ